MLNRTHRSLRYKQRRSYAPTPKTRQYRAGQDIARTPATPDGIKASTIEVPATCGRHPGSCLRGEPGERFADADLIGAGSNWMPRSKSRMVPVASFHAIADADILAGGPIWREQNPVRYAANFKTPILLTGDKDPALLALRGANGVETGMVKPSPNPRGRAAAIAVCMRHADNAGDLAAFCACVALAAGLFEHHRIGAGGRLAGAGPGRGPLAGPPGIEPQNPEGDEVDEHEDQEELAP